MAEYKDVYEGRFLKSVELADGMLSVGDEERGIFVYFTFTDKDGILSPVHCRTIRNRKLGTNSIDLIERFGQGLVVELI